MLGIFFNQDLKHAHKKNWETTLKKWKTISKNCPQEFWPYTGK